MDVTVLAPLPEGVDGHFGPELRRFVLMQYHQVPFSNRVPPVNSLLLVLRRFGRSFRQPTQVETQLSHRYASDTRNAPENCGVPRPMSICGAKNHCPFRGHLALTGSTLMCWRRCSRNAVRTVGRRKSRLGPSIFARRTSVRAPTTLARVVPKSLCAPQCFDFKSYFFVWWESWVRTDTPTGHNGASTASSAASRY